MNKEFRGLKTELLKQRKKNKKSDLIQKESTSPAREKKVDENRKVYGKVDGKVDGKELTENQKGDKENIK